MLTNVGVLAKLTSRSRRILFGQTERLVLIRLTRINFAVHSAIHICHEETSRRRLQVLVIKYLIVFRIYNKSKVQ